MDIAVAWDTARFRGDWTIARGALGVDPGIRSAVLLSLFTDRRASPDFTPTDGTDNRRGWWGDTYEPSLLGSRLWQLNRAKKTDGTTLLLKARDYCKEALQWLVDAGAAASVDVVTAWHNPTTIAIGVTVAMPGGAAIRTQYLWAWGAA
jgi:phage gp46-like protein